MKFSTAEKFMCVGVFMLTVAIIIAVAVPLIVHDFEVVLDFWKLLK